MQEEGHGREAVAKASSCSQQISYCWYCPQLWIVDHHHMIPIHDILVCTQTLTIILGLLLQGVLVQMILIVLRSTKNVIRRLEEW